MCIIISIMNSTIKTRQITRGAMVCAIYGVMLLVNQQFALALEESMSWLFAFPILIYAAQNPVAIAGVCALAMALESFLFGGFTTWFYSWTSILIGLCYGIGVYKRWSNGLKLGVTFVLSCVSYGLIFAVWAGIFGLDLQEDFAWIQRWLPFVDWRVFVGAVVFLLSLLQTVCIHLLAVMVCIRMKIWIPPIRKVAQIRPKRWIGFVTIVLLALFSMSQSMVKCSSEIQDIVMMATFIDLCVLDYYGIVYMMDRCIRHNKRSLTFFAILGGFVPGLNLIWIVLGELDCLIGLRKDRGK